MGGSSSKYYRVPRNEVRVVQVPQAKPAPPPAPLPVPTAPPQQPVYVQPASYAPTIPYIDSDESNTCPYGWVFSVGACVLSLCVLLVFTVFAIWLAVNGTTTVKIG